MTNQQEQSFNEGLGNFFTAGDMLSTVQLSGATLAFLYVAWLSLTAYQNYCDGEIDSSDVLITALRGAGFLLVLIYLLR